MSNLSDKPPGKTYVRLNKAIADSGYCARRKADELIVAGQVCVNGKLVKTLGEKVCLAQDTITIDGRLLPQEAKVYLLFHKPVGFLTSREGTRNQRTIYTLLPQRFQSVDPAGRLDYESSGALILSNDGDFIHQVTHPRFHWEKQYAVKLNKPLSKEHVKRLEAGVFLKKEGKRAKMLSVKPDPNFPLTYNVVLVTGYNRQIRRSLEALGYTVEGLHRHAIGLVSLGAVMPGSFRKLTRQEWKGFYMETEKTPES